MRLSALLVGLAVCSLGGEARKLVGDSTPAVFAVASPAEGARTKSLERVVAWHFVGTAGLAGNTNGTRAKEILAQPASQWVLGNTLDKLARAPGAWLALGAATNPPTAALLRPWLEELLAAESCGEFALGPGRESAVVAAVRTSAEKNSALQAKWVAWASAVGGTAPAEVNVGNFTAREIKFSGIGGWSRIAQSGGWTLIGLGKGSDGSFTDLAERVGKLAAPEGWLGVKVGGLKLAELLGWSNATRWPEAEFQITGRGPILRTTARLTYSQPLDLKIESWRIPTHTMGDPVVSFTVVQGIRSWLGQQAWWRQLGLPTTPSQAVGWTIAEIPFASYLSWEMPEVTNALTQLGPKVPPFLAQYIPKIRFGEVAFQTNATRVAWIDLPITEPFVSPAADQDRGFAVAGLFPLVKPRRPLPPELLTQVMGRTNLVYYDWELTTQRINGWRHVKNLYSMLAGYLPPSTNHTGEAWLSDTNVLDRLGNTGTELTLASPRELAGVRNSALGLTGLELVALMRWLDDPAFPSLSEPAMSPSLLRRARAKETTGTNAAPTPRASPPSPSPRARPLRPSR